jgi:dynein heavy chain
MTYEQRSDLRKECSKFLRFSYLIDFLGLDSLRTIYKESVSELLKELNDLVKFT